MSVARLDKRKRTPRALPLAQSSGAARFFNKMIRDVESDLGGRRHCSRVENALIRAFCGSATRLEYLNLQILLGEDCEADLASYAQLASVMLRIGSRLGLRRRARDVTPTVDEYLRHRQRANADAIEAADAS